MKSTLKALSLAVIASASTATFAAEEATPTHSFSGNISVLSSYILRGNTTSPENTDATLQGGLDYSHASGLYAGWWTSTLGTDVYGTSNPMENNFYAGYNGKISDDLGYTIGGTYYYYYDVGTSDNNGLELLLGLNYKDVAVTAQTLLKDTLWGNSGDTYLKASYSYPLPKDFSLDTALGLYYYKENGKFNTSTETFGFRHFDIGLSKPLGDTGITANMNYIIGGYDRFDNKHKNKVVFGVGYSF
ncbi:TorF family putative porin [Acinetobacter shaoyimingii]|uniref:Porin n=1 Tax=Acinetobacter shaoyimingii TaxID=2715164 RepID=A0A6G8S078_9GAMM|nr:TorF family putative porin [Acinetobacter shaoyimingii]QIO07557.1 hypothetical protein G8E00_15095 [Acinetobacter shaoyimingii]